MTKFKLKPLEWFKENTYVDAEGDYWRTEEGRNEYYNLDSRYTSDYIELYQIKQNVLSESEYYSHNKIPRYDWCLEKVLTPTTDPEYFI